MSGVVGIVGVLVRTLEIDQILGCAPLPIYLITPAALSQRWIEDQTSWTLLPVRRAVGAEVEHVAHRRVGVGKVPVQPWASTRGLRGLELVPAVARNTEGETALGEGMAGLVEHQPVRTQVLRYHAVLALIVSIALQSVRKKSRWLRTIRYVVIVLGISEGGEEKGDAGDKEQHFHYSILL